MYLEQEQQEHKSRSKNTNPNLRTQTQKLKSQNYHFLNPSKIIKSYQINPKIQHNQSKQKNLKLRKTHLKQANPPQT